MNNKIGKPSSDGSFAVSKAPRVAHIENDQPGFNVHAILGYLAQYVNMTNIVSNIHKGTQYVVQIPTHLQAALDTGKYTMLHGEASGKTWATIVQRLSNGKNDFIANCPIREEAFYPGNPIQDMANSFANLQLQQQMAVLTQLLGETYDAILRVEAGQKADRIGQLVAGRNGIIHALKMKDADSRKLQIVVARGSLQEAQSKIGEVLKQKVDSFKSLSKYAIARFFQECAHTGYLDKCDDEYNATQDYFDLYMQVTKLISESYLICGEKESAISVFDESRHFIEQLDFSKLETILYSHPKRKPKELFIHTALPGITAERKLCLESTKPYDYIEITLNGKEILEVLEYDQ